MNQRFVIGEKSPAFVVSKNKEEIKFDVKLLKNLDRILQKLE